MGPQVSGHGRCGLRERVRHSSPRAVFFGPRPTLQLWPKVLLLVDLLYFDRWLLSLFCLAFQCRLMCFPTLCMLQSIETCNFRLLTCTPTCTPAPQATTYREKKVAAFCRSEVGRVGLYYLRCILMALLLVLGGGWRWEGAVIYNTRPRIALQDDGFLPS